VLFLESGGWVSAEQEINIQRDQGRWPFEVKVHWLKLLLLAKLPNVFFVELTGSNLAFHPMGI